MLWPYLKIRDWDLIFGCAVKAFSSLGVRSPWAVERKEKKSLSGWIFFFVVPGGICGKKQGFHINDDRVVAATNIIRYLQI